MEADLSFDEHKSEPEGEEEHEIERRYELIYAEMLRKDLEDQRNIVLTNTLPYDSLPSCLQCITEEEYNEIIIHKPIWASIYDKNTKRVNLELLNKYLRESKAPIDSNENKLINKVIDCLTSTFSEWRSFLEYWDRGTQWGGLGESKLFVVLPYCIPAEKKEYFEWGNRPRTRMDLLSDFFSHLGEEINDAKSNRGILENQFNDIKDAINERPMVESRFLSELRERAKEPL